MTFRMMRYHLACVLFTMGVAFAPKSALAQLQPVCFANSPERRGEPGCSIVADKQLPEDLHPPLFWHIDRFDSGDQARAAEGPSSISVDAHSGSWLLTIESKTANHQGGRHIASVGPLPLPSAPKYALQVLSAIFTPGMSSLVHHHAGVEAWYVLSGEQCLETPTAGYKTRAGETFLIEPGVVMRLVTTGSTVRRALAVIVYDASQPPTTRMEKGPPLISCK